MTDQSKPDRPNWDLWFMRQAYVTSQRGSCTRLRVGALIVRDRDHRVISGGYNGAPRGMPDCLQVGCDLRPNLDGRESCVPGDTIVSKLLSGHYNSRHRTIGQIFDMWQDPDQRKGMRLMKVRSASKTGMIVPGRIVDVWRSSAKPLVEIKTAIGRSVRLTDNHLMLTPSGWCPAGALTPGDLVALNGVSLVNDEAWLRERYASGLSMEAIAMLASVHRSVVHRRMIKFGIERRPRQDLREVSAAGWNRGKIREAAHTYKGRSVVHDSTARSRARRYAFTGVCAMCGVIGDHLEVHHLDGDCRNDAQANLLTLCRPCHELADTPHAKRERVVFDRIVTMRGAGHEPVYDMTIEGQHNFVGNGFVLHNCFRTLHAESNALDLAGLVDNESHTLYVTVTPCRNCALRIVQHGIKRVVYHRYYESQGTNEVEAIFAGRDPATITLLTKSYGEPGVAGWVPHARVELVHLDVLDREVVPTY